MSESCLFEVIKPPPFKICSVAYYTEKRQDAANFLSTGEKNQGLAKEGEIKMSPFYVEGDREVIKPSGQCGVEREIITRSIPNVAAA
jgi:hypothetical protein